MTTLMLSTIIVTMIAKSHNGNNRHHHTGITIIMRVQILIRKIIREYIYIHTPTCLNKKCRIRMCMYIHI